MIDKWLALIEGERLSRSESSIVKKFSQDPEGKYFLQFSDVLKSHGKTNESLELLIEGVGRHPSFSVARVLLSKNLLEKGLIDEAWQNLEESPVSLDTNKLAQKLKIKLSILLGLEDICRNLLFEQKPSSDSEVISIKQDIVNLGFDTARIKLIESLELDKEFILKNFTPSKVKKLHQSDSSISSESTQGSDKSDQDDIEISPTQQSTNNSDPATFNNFRLSNLSNAFTDEADTSLNQNFASSSLSSMTLASIYARQGHYGKALGIYRQLLLEKPHSKVLQEKIEELSRLDQKQAISDIGVDPELADELERMKEIDYKISILNSLMSKLDSDQ